jgi:hypothetical protein
MPNTIDDKIPVTFSPSFFPVASVNNRNTAAHGGSSNARSIYGNCNGVPGSIFMFLLIRLEIQTILIEI